MKKFILFLPIIFFSFNISAQEENYTPVPIPEEGGIFGALGRINFMDIKNPTSPSEAEAVAEGISLIFDMKDQYTFRMSILDLTTQHQMVINPYHISYIKDNHIVVKPLYLTASSDSSNYQEVFSLYKDNTDTYYLKREIEGISYVEFYTGKWLSTDELLAQRPVTTDDGIIKESDLENNSENLSETSGLKPVPASDQLNINWGIGSEFRTTSGMFGTYWDATMRVLCTGDKYILSIMRPASDGYSTIYEGDNCYLKTHTGEIITLPLLTEYGVWNYYQKGHYVANTYMNGRFITQMFYEIPDLSVLSRYKIQKIRYFINHSHVDIDLIYENNVNRFNENIKKSALQAQQDYGNKQVLEDDPTAGF